MQRAPALSGAPPRAAHRHFSDAWVFAVDVTRGLIVGRCYMMGTYILFITTGVGFWYIYEPILMRFLTLVFGYIRRIG